MKKTTGWLRVLAVAMTFVLLMTAFGGCKKNNEEDVLVSGIVSGDYEYTRSKKTDTARISKYSGKAESLEIPETLDGLPVVAIEADAFEGCETLTKVTLPDSLDRIESGAFKKCAALTSVELDDALTYIGDYAFHRCTSLKSMDIPDAVKEIGKDAFSECSELKTVVLGKNITTVGTNAFYGTPWFASLTSEFVIVGDGVLIDYNGEKTDVTVPKTVKHLTSTFANNTMLFSVTLPEGMTTIDNNAFQGCTNLSSIKIPDSVTSIGAYAFARCTSLSGMKISDKITSIGSRAFTGCIALREITIPSSITVIPEEAFSGCQVLTRVSFSNTLTEIKKNAFYECGAISVVAYSGSESEWNEVTVAEGNETLSNAILNCAQ